MLDEGIELLLYLLRQDRLWLLRVLILPPVVLRAAPAGLAIWSFVIRGSWTARALRGIGSNMM